VHEVIIICTTVINGVILKAADRDIDSILFTGTATARESYKFINHEDYVYHEIYNQQSLSI